MKAMTKTEPVCAAGVSFRIIALRTGLSRKEPELMGISFKAHLMPPIRVKYPVEKYCIDLCEEPKKEQQYTFSCQKWTIPANSCQYPPACFRGVVSLHRDSAKESGADAEDTETQYQPFFNKKLR